MSTQKQIRPLTLKEFTRSQLEWNNKLIQCSSTLAFQLGNTPIKLKIQPVNHVRPPDRHMHCIKLQARNQNLWITINQWPQSLITTHPDIASLVESSSNTIRKMAVEIILDPILAWIEIAIGSNITVVDYFREKPKQQHRIAVSFLYQENSSDQYTGQVSLSKGLKKLFYNVLKDWPTTQVIVNDTLRITSPLTIGNTRITTADLNYIEIDHIIFLEQDFYSKDRLLIATFAPNILITLKQLTKTMAESDLKHYSKSESSNNTSVSTSKLKIQTITKDNTVDQTIPENHLIENLEIKLDFDLGHLSLSLAEIKKLQPGHIFSVGRPLDKAVYISSNGKRLARGELVDVDGNVGVRVKKIYKRNK